jgi:membrane protease YdiL (CAAX protease family)
MPDDPNTPKNAKWKKLTRILVHILYLILAIMLLVAALNLGDPNASSIFLLVLYGTIIALFLIFIEIFYFFRLKKSSRTPDFVKRNLGFLTNVVGRGVFYQLIGGHYLVSGHWQRWWSSAVFISVPSGWFIWFIGLCLTALAVVAKAYNFADWIEDKEDEGGLRLESDDEGDIDFRLLRDPGGSNEP